MADEISRRWIATVDSAYLQTGFLYETYDVEAVSVGTGGEYTAQIGFGWTNGDTADLIDQGQA